MPSGRGTHARRWLEAIRVNTQSLEASIGTETLLAWCDGHFPGEPVFPGACVAAAAIEAAEQWRPGPVREIVSALFRAPIRPSAELRVQAHSTLRGTRVLMLVGVDQAASVLVSHGPVRLPDAARKRPDNSSNDELADHSTIQSYLRHRTPALMLREQTHRWPDGGEFHGILGEWSWPRLLDGAAQAAGMCLRGRRDLAAAAVYVAAFDGIRGLSGVVDALRFRVMLRRRILDMWQYDVQALDAHDTVVLDVRTTLATAG